MPTLAASDHITEQEAAERAALISDVRYDITIDISAGDRVDEQGASINAGFGSVSTVTFTSARDAASTFLNITASEITSVTLNGTELQGTQYEFENSRLVINGLRSGENTVVVSATCEYTQNGVGLHRLVDPTDRLTYVYTHFEPFDAHRVFACFDQPDLKAAITTTIRAPRDWEICGNGRVLGRDDNADGSRTWRINTTPLVPTYLAAFCGGPYRMWETSHKNIPMRLYCRGSMATFMEAQSEEIFRVTKQGLDFFEDDFGYAYPFDEYNQLFVPEFNMGAMENPGCVTFNEAYVHRSKPSAMQRARRAEVILHEMAHVYGFGDVATMKWWGDLWLNETFATYMSQKAMVTATQYTNAWVDFANTVKAVAARQDQLRSTHPISTPCRDTDEVRQNFDGITYHKGASVLKQLVHWVGEDAFTAGVKAYFVKYRWANATLDDFLQCIEDASGRDLQAWSKEWLQTAGMNTLRPDVVVEDGRIVSLAVLQEAAPAYPTLRSHRIAVGLYSLADNGDLTRTHRVELDIAGPRTEVEGVAGQAADLIVVNDDDLTFAKIRFDSGSQATLVKHLGHLTDPLTRAVAWAAMWDMTRDAELPTRDYVECVVRNAGSETDTTMLERMLGQATTAVEQFGDPNNREAALTRLAGKALEELRRADPGSERQLILARAFVGAARDDASLDIAAGLLEGTETIEGLAVDTDLRWLLLGRLAGEGRADAALIDEELQRDSTDFGRRRAAACLSARPLEEAKADAWREVTEGSPNLQMQAAIMGGFSVGVFGAGGFLQYGKRQEPLLRPYVQRWVDALPGIWANREYDEAEYFTDILFPRTFVEEATIEATQRAIEAIAASGLGDSTQRAATRSLIEGQDGIARALKARAADATGGQPASETS